MSYASGTAVNVERSQSEIEKLVLQRGGKKFFRADTGEAAVIGFTFGEGDSIRRVMFELPKPQPGAFTTVKRGKRQVKAEPHQVEQMLRQAEREAWRALALAVKAKFVAIEAKVESFEEAFLAHIVIQSTDGRQARFYRLAGRAIAESYKNGGLPALPMLGAGSGDAP